MPGGRPFSKSHELDVDEYHRLRLCNQSDAAIAVAWGISPRTLRRWKTIHVDGKLRGQELEEAINDMQEVDPNLSRGYRMVQAQFLSRSIYVSRDAVMDTMRRLDPDAAEARRHQVVLRRQYNSPGFGNCWHCDTCWNT